MNAIVIRANEGEIVERDGIRYTIKAKSEKLLVMLCELEIGKETPFYEHTGEELRFVLEGEIECSIGGEKYILKAGDAIWHSSKIPHKVKNVGKNRAVYVAIGTPATFF
ncbi:MAG: cupin domain-containing protein [Archaeoglobaceae archaeon]|nr:cupin domain-containing protein [Archaeoglobaceae archaeon]MCX8152209.1 cupin domain-containing protein [Archaeoglobaceae archaeon]MDW8013995.1 cupin domain-containing protein [Archaeoglobaceae archaeon]